MENYNYLIRVEADEKIPMMFPHCGNFNQVSIAASNMMDTLGFTKAEIWSTRDFKIVAAILKIEQ